MTAKRMAEIINIFFESVIDKNKKIKNKQKIYALTNMKGRACHRARTAAIRYSGIDVWLTISRPCFKEYIESSCSQGVINCFYVGDRSVSAATKTTDIRACSVCVANRTCEMNNSWRPGFRNLRSPSRAPINGVQLVFEVAIQLATSVAWSSLVA